MGRILVVEDDPGTQLLLQSRLKDLGHDVAVKPTGAQGIAEARSSSFDLYLVDMNLGEGVDGIEVCRRLKRDPETRNVPVVLISGQIRSRADLHRGYEAGCESFLIKNDMSLIEDAIRAMLRIKSLSDELSTQMVLLQQRNEHLQEALQDKAELEDALARSSDGASTVEGRRLLPDGVVLVDAEGTVTHADRGAREIFAKRIEGRSLGSLAPGTRLEAFVRDATTTFHKGFRFTVSARGNRPPQRVVASVLPLVPNTLGSDGDPTVVLLYDERRQQALWDRLRAASGEVVLVENGALVEAARREYRPGRLLGTSLEIAAVRARLQALADGAEPVLIRGERGTGKRFVGRVLHYAGDRTGPFVPVGCEDLGRERIEDELFGDEERPGLVLRAQGGTLFLEDVDALPEAVQERLVATLEAGELEVLGERKPRALDVRLVASLSREEHDQLGESMRRALAEHVTLPPLRERSEDVFALTRDFLDRCSTTPELLEIAPDAWAALEHYEWPGNVHELEACITQACRTAGPNVQMLEVHHLVAPLPDVHRRLVERGQVTPSQRPTAAVPGTHQAHSALAVPEALRDDLGEVVAALPDLGDDDIPVSFEFFEKWALNLALSRSEGDKLAAAKLLKVGKSTLYRKLHKYDIH